MPHRIRISDGVRRALDERRAVVALETTLIAHGLPQPDNLEVAHDAEALVRAEGGVPATIGVIAGVATIGLDEGELELMATTSGVPKLSARDVPVAAALGVNGATTVAATASLAAQAGIRVFATGGLGGVHRAANESWDESADLDMLARTPIALVCSGVKSILDVPATLERLETLGVTVVGWRTTSFPGFYLTDSGRSIDWSVASESEAAGVIEARASLGAGGGVLIANPIAPEEQLDPATHDRVLSAGLTALDDRSVRGKAVTPFLLDYFATATGGASLEINKQIIRNNARLAARIACALAGGAGGS